MEQEYWNYKSNLDRTYGDLQHQAAMDALMTEAEYKLFAMLKPKLFKDGDKWCCLYGENIIEGVVGFGDSPYLAILSFNKEMQSPITKP